MKRKPYKRRSESGAVIFEAVLAICIMMMFFFALMQIYKWAQTELFCNYSVFYAAKAASLGYRPNIALRAGRVAAIPVSGSAGAGRYDEEVYAASYLQNGDASGVHYAYWHPQSEEDPCLLIGSSSLDGETITCKTELRNMPLLNQAIAKVFGITQNPEPKAEGQVWNYSRLFLQGNNSE